MPYPLWFLFFYFLGGLTFIPIVVLLFFLVSLWVLPRASGTSNDSLSDDVDLANGTKLPSSQRSNSVSSSASTSSALSGTVADTLSVEREQESGTDAYFSGWLTVSREYFIYPTGGTNNTGKPPPLASSIASLHQNESAYSTLYKLINSSKSSTSSPSASSASLTSGQPSASASMTKKSSLVKYFGVLRHGNLFLYDGSDQKNVKQVINVAHHLVVLWPPNLPDGQLFVKRTAICLVRIPSGYTSVEELDNYMKTMLSDANVPPKNAFYLYSDFCSEKEDFYFALIRASKRYKPSNIEKSANASLSSISSIFNPVLMAHPLGNKTSEMIGLIKSLHISESNVQTLWINALFGRLFLSLNETEFLASYFRNRIVTKISRTKRPSFLSEIEVTKILCGNAVPFFSNPRLAELTPEGQLSIETDLKYDGKFVLEITTNVLINLGTRFKTREVPIALSVTLTHLEGRLIIKMKAPPSDRLWYAFETMPKISLEVEPIVSNRQITYSVITNAIETRIKEAIKESLVLPNFDDLAFFNTNGEIFRGGIWDHNVQASRVPYSSTNSETNPQSSENQVSENNSTKEQTSTTEPLASRDVEMFTPSAVKQLRHRKTLADFRDHASPENSSLSNNIFSEEYKFSSSASLTTGPKSTDNIGCSSRKQSFASISTSSSGRSIHDGEFISTLESKSATSKNNNFTEFKRDAKITITETMKKWGTWYNKGKRAATDPKDSVNKQNPKLPVPKSSTFTSTPTLATSPTSLMFEPSASSTTTSTSLDVFTQNTADLDSVDGTESLLSLKAQGKPVSTPPDRTTNLNENDLGSTSNELSTAENKNDKKVKEENEEEESHSINPGLTVLRKTTASPKVTVPAESHVGAHVSQSNPIAIVPAPSGATVAVTSERVSGSSGSTTATSSFQAVLNPDDAFGETQSDLGTISDLHTILVSRRSSNSSQRPGSITSSARSIKSQDDLARRLKGSVLAAADANAMPSHPDLSRAASDSSRLGNSLNSRSSGSIRRVRRKAVGSGPGHDTTSVAETATGELPRLQNSKLGLEPAAVETKGALTIPSVVRVPVSKPDVESF